MTTITGSVPKPTKPTSPTPIERIDSTLRRDRIADSIIAKSKSRKRFARWLPIAIVMLATLAGLLSPLASWLVVLVAGVAIICIVCPVQPLLLIMFFLALAVDNPRANPSNGLWSAPWMFIGDALYKNLEPLPLCLLDLLAGGCLVRGLFHKRTESHVRLARERVFSRIVAIAIGTLLFTMLSGIIRSGDLKQAVYQIRVFLWIPSFAIAIATTADIKFLRRIKALLLACAVVKSLTGFWVYLTVESTDPKLTLDFVTTHGDSVTYTMAFAIVIAGLVGAIPKRYRQGHGIALVCTLIGLYSNQRRIAFVGMAFALLLMYQDAIPERRRVINRTVSRFLLPAVLYFAVAFTGVSRAPIFRPALSLRSVVIQDDRSSSTRDIENFNLYYTYKSNPLIGVGFGHEYIELIQADYIGDVFPQYRFLPHNSMLGLYSFGGMVAGIGYYLLFPASLYLGLRATKRKYSPERWMYSMMGASGIAALLIQGYGDVGFHDQVVGVLGGIAVGVCGALYCMPDEERVRAKPIDARAAVKLEN